MKTYKVKSGDTLGSIAMKQLGNADLWSEIAELNDIINVNKIQVGQKLLLPTINDPEPSTQKSDVILIDEGKKVYYKYKNDGNKSYLGTRYKNGLSRRGAQKTGEFIANNASLLKKLKISNSELNSLLVTSKNEGNLDAINTYDNSYMSFGMFQWTLGTGSSKGELPALAKLVKEKYPDAFEQFCGQFGVKVSADTNSVDGYLIYKNKKVNTAAEKQFFRNDMVAYRFATAGMDKRVDAVQVLHAINRFNRFYFVNTSKLGGNTLYELLSSEYAASLFLDNHVNRPGYLFPCVAKAVQASGMSYDQLKNGGDNEEMTVINHYLKIRETYGKYPMTDAKHRADVAKQALNEGKISAKKGSFKSNRKLR